MKTPKHESHVASVTLSTNTTTEGATTMSTPKSTPAESNAVSEPTVPSAAASVPVAAKAAAVSAASPAPTTALPSVVALPPALSTIPSVPDGEEPTNATDYRGLTPKKAELAALGAAIGELQNATEFTAVFGRTMPSLDYIVQTLNAANQWSKMRNKTGAYDQFARTQEGLAWISARMVMTRMKPVLEQAASANAEVATQFRSLLLLLGAAKAIAVRGATTRKGNAKLEANGQLPTKGKVGKKRQRDAEVAAYAAAEAAKGSGAAAPTGTSAQSTSAPVAAATAPASSAAATEVSPQQHS